MHYLSEIEIEFKNDTNRKKNFNLECPICLDIVNEPIILECCSYRFCFKCLNMCLNIRLKCPLCTKDICKNNLKANIILEKENSLYNKIEKVKQNEIDEIKKWKFKYDELQNYLKEHNKPVSYILDDDPYVNELYYWIVTQDFWYKKKWYIMKKEEVRNIWQEFKENDTIFSNKIQWEYIFDELKKYIKNYKKFPIFSENNSKKVNRLAYWFKTQNFWYKNRLYIIK